MSGGWPRGQIVPLATCLQTGCARGGTRSTTHQGGSEVAEDPSLPPAVVTDDLNYIQVTSNCTKESTTMPTLAVVDSLLPPTTETEPLPATKAVVNEPVACAPAHSATNQSLGSTVAKNPTKESTTTPTRGCRSPSASCH